MWHRGNAGTVHGFQLWSVDRRTSTVDVLGNATMCLHAVTLTPFSPLLWPRRGCGDGRKDPKKGTNHPVTGVPGRIWRRWERSSNLVELISIHHKAKADESCMGFRRHLFRRGSRLWFRSGTLSGLEYAKDDLHDVQERRQREIHLCSLPNVQGMLRMDHDRQPRIPSPESCCSTGAAIQAKRHVLGRPHNRRPSLADCLYSLHVFSAFVPRSFIISPCCVSSGQLRSLSPLFQLNWRAFGPWRSCDRSIAVSLLVLFWKYTKR